MTPLLKWLLLGIAGVGGAVGYIESQSDKVDASVDAVQQQATGEPDKGASKTDEAREASRTDTSHVASAEHSGSRDAHFVRDAAPQAVVWTNGLLSVHLEKRPLAWVLDRIAQQTGLSIVVAPELQSASVTSRFEELELTQGLRQLLSPWDAFFFFSDNRVQGQLQSVWVYPAGQGHAIAPLPPEQWASTQELERNLADGDPEVRIKTLETLVARSGDRAIDNITAALNDTDERVRYRALDVTLNAGVTLPTETLLALAENDPSPPIRRLALEALAHLSEGPRDPGFDIQKLSERALSDPDPAVSRKAEQLISPGRGLDPVDGRLKK